MPRIPALGRLKQDDLKFKASLNYSRRLYPVPIPKKWWEDKIGDFYSFI